MCIVLIRQRKVILLAICLRRLHIQHLHGDGYISRWGDFEEFIKDLAQNRSIEHLLIDWNELQLQEPHCSNFRSTYLSVTINFVNLKQTKVLFVQNLSVYLP
mmetsp:Transcript_14057/g.26785  ORF Transcript_14057/g.26785 Transcript_14057/m.26785 type:complete len:102 (-) Transcript_14057:7-312(-)